MILPPCNGCGVMVKAGEALHLAGLLFLLASTSFHLYEQPQNFPESQIPTKVTTINKVNDFCSMILFWIELLRVLNLILFFINIL